MKTLNRICPLFILAIVPVVLWAQADTTVPQLPAAVDTPSSPAPEPVPAADQPMMTPSVVSGEPSSVASMEESQRSNYLRYGASVSVAYEDNVLSSAGNVGSDVTYTIGPNISLDLTRPRYRWDLSYSPGFTFYQRHGSLNQTSHALGLNFSYRLSPHVTFTAQDSLIKSSGVFSPLDFTTNGLPNPVQSPNFALVAPVQDTFLNSATVGLSYQFGRNDSIGVTGYSSILRYLNSSQSGGLFDSTTNGGGGYYTHRFANRNYLGVNYSFGDIHTERVNVETKTQSFYGSYTFYVKPTFSLTAFGGPQYSDTSGGGFPEQRMWSPSGGGGVSWQGEQTGFAANFSRRISDGGGLQGAVRSNSADATFHAQLTRTITGSASGSYSTNTVLDPILPNAGSNGHSLSASVSAGRSFGEHLSASVGYAYLHQTYNNLSLINFAPSQNRVWISISYEFERPLGR